MDSGHVSIWHQSTWFFARIELKYACNSKGELLKIRTLTNRARGKRTHGVLRKAYLWFYWLAKSLFLNSSQGLNPLSPTCCNNWIIRKKGVYWLISQLILKVMAVKKNIEDVQGKDNYPCGQQLLIHNGKVLKDETTLADNNVSEDGFLVVMLSKVYFFITCFLFCLYCEFNMFGFCYDI